MITIDLNIDKFGAYLFSTLEYIENEYAHCALEYCDRKDADFKVVERWRDNDNKRRQSTTYLKKIDS